MLARCPALSCCWKALGQVLVGTSLPSSRAHALQTNPLQSRSIPKGTLSLQPPHAKYLQLQCLAPAVGKASSTFFQLIFGKHLA